MLVEMASSIQWGFSCASLGAVLLTMTGGLEGYSLETVTAGYVGMWTLQDCAFHV
jgi:hypothetical protein